MLNSQNGPPVPYKTAKNDISTLHQCPNVTLHGRHAVATYGAEVAIPDGQVVLRLLLILQHNHTRAAHMDNEASCRK